MSQRSRREYKPTSKFLDYKIQELNRSDGEGMKNKRIPIPVKSVSASLSAKRRTIHCTSKRSPVNLASKQSSAHLASKRSPVTLASKQSSAHLASKRSPILSAKRAAIHGRRKLATDKIEILCESTADSSPEIQDKSTEIRRSSRAVKPNSKLKEFLHSTHLAKSEPDSSSAKSTVTNLCKNEVTVDGLHSSKKSLSVTHDRDSTGQESVHGRSNMFSVGLADCFEGLTKDLAKNYPSPMLDGSKEKLRDLLNQSKSRLDRSKRGVKRSLVKDMEDCNESYSKKKRDNGNDPETKRGNEFEDTLAKSRLITDNESRMKRERLAPRDVKTDESRMKRERLAPRDVWNLTKTKKSTRVTTVVKTVNLSNNRKQRTITKNKKLKVTKEYPVKIPVTTPTASKEAHLLTSKVSASPLAVAFQGLQNSHNKQVAQNQSKDIKETLKKFLIMGTKVANAISETLKHNEEALLSKSSAFEKKCLSLVHALAKQGSDLEESDMEKVLKLLDEEQEERRIYRHTLMESLRASHLTNMALYSQMLRLLKTL